MQTLAYHNSNVMAVAERQWSITIHQILVYTNEAFKILRMKAHHLKHVLQTVILQENVHQKIDSLPMHTHNRPHLPMCCDSATYRLLICVSICNLENRDHISVNAPVLILVMGMDPEHRGSLVEDVVDQGLSSVLTPKHHWQQNEERIT